MQVHRRDFTRQEIADFYAPRSVYEVESYFSIRPLNETEGTVVLDIPKNLPVTEDGRLIDFTLTYSDLKRDIENALETKFDGDLYLRFGRLDPESSSICQRLILGENLKPDAIQLIVHHHRPMAWGGTQLPTLPNWLTSNNDVLAHNRAYLGGSGHLDIWLIRTIRIPEKARALINCLYSTHCTGLFY